MGGLDGMDWTFIRKLELIGGMEVSSWSISSHSWMGPGLVGMDQEPSVCIIKETYNYLLRVCENDECC